MTATNHDEAIGRAVDARAAIARVIESVQSGKADLAAAFAAADADPLTGRCFAVKVFEAVPGIGKVRARRTMAAVGLADDVWLGNVAQNERTAIAVAFAQA